MDQAVAFFWRTFRSRKDGADVLGCTSMVFHDVTKKLQDRIGVPVVNPVVASLKTAEMLVAVGLS